MTLPITYPRWADRQKLCHLKGEHIMVCGKRYCYPQTSAIQQSAQWLIERLYVPCSLTRHPWGVVLRRDVDTLTAPWAVSQEPINWGDLAVVKVSRRGSLFEVSVEEASPDCVAFPNYLRYWLGRWGWKYVSVRTEW